MNEILPLHLKEHFYSRYIDKKRFLLWWALILLVCLSPIYGAVFNPKFFSINYIDQITQIKIYGPSETARLVGRILKGLFIMIPTITIVLAIFHPPRFNRETRIFWVSAMLFALGPVLSSIFGTEPVFSHEVLIIPALLTSVFLLSPVSLEWFICRIKVLLLLVYVYGSILVILVFPKFGLETNYNAGLLSTVRLHGLSTHANNLAPLLALYLLLESYWSGRCMASWLHRFIALVLLLFTQSKTTCLAMLIIVVAQLLYVAWLRMRRLRVFLFISLVILTISFGMVILLFGLSSLVMVENTPNIKVMSNFSTLTSRTLVWEYTMQLWRENILFGYGPMLFNSDMSLKFYKLYHWAPSHAHNQWFQTLGQSGIVGAVGLLIYTFALIGMGLRYIHITNGGSFALVLLLLIRGLTEVSFRFSLSDGNFLIHFSIYGILMLLSRSIVYERMHGLKVRDF